MTVDHFFQRVSELLCIGIIIALPWQTRWIAIPGELNGVPWEYGTLSLYAIDLIVLFFLGISIARSFHTKKHSLSLPQALALFLLAIAFFSTYFATNQLSTIYWFLTLTEGIALFFAISQSHIRENIAPWAFIVTGVIQSLLAILQFSMQEVASSKWMGMAAQLPETLGTQVIESGAERTLRAYGSLPHPNMLGGLLVVTILCVLMMFCQKKSASRQTLLLAALLLMSAALWMTFSRQAWIALAMSAVIVVVYTFIKETVFPASLVVALCALLIPFLTLSLIFPQLISTRFNSQERLEERSLTERVAYAEDSMQILREHWFTGVGVGNMTAFLHAQDRRQNITKDGYAYQPVHNIVLLVFTELGIFGLLVFVLFFLSCFYHLRLNDVHILFWLLCLISLGVIGLFDHYLWSLHFGILFFWLISGLLIQARVPVDS